jgi:hypothetical protein
VGVLKNPGCGVVLVSAGVAFPEDGGVFVGLVVGVAGSGLAGDCCGCGGGGADVDGWPAWACRMLLIRAAMTQRLVYLYIKTFRS